MNTGSKTADYLSSALQASPLTPEDISARVGLSRVSHLTMMAHGLTRVPLDRIPALSAALDVRCSEFLFTALEEYYPEVHRLLTEVLALPLDRDEEELVGLYRFTALDGRIPVEGAVGEEIAKILEDTRAG